MTTEKDTVRVDELRRLAAQIVVAVEKYAAGESDDTSDIVRQCHDMHYTAESPEVFAARLRYQPLDLCALMIALECGILQALTDQGAEEASADMIAKITQRPIPYIIRTLRLLSSIGACDEVGIRRYKANDKTRVLVTPGQIGGFRVSSLPVCRITTNIADYCSSFGHGHAETMPQKSAYEFSFGKPMYDVLREIPARRADFDAYMEGRKHERNRKWHDTYPVMAQLASINEQNDKENAPEPTIVDVGGNRGHDLESFISCTPEFHGRLILQDLPETIHPLLAEKKPGELLFEAMPHDFFKTQPIEGASLYLLLSCLHNWDDDASRKILTNLAHAMDLKFSRLLISAVLLPEIGADRRSAELDMQMWMLQQSNHRTKGEMENLVASAGLEIVHVWENAPGESIIEVGVAQKGVNGHS